jgi:hypothetical protein
MQLMKDSCTKCGCACTECHVATACVSVTASDLVAQELIVATFAPSGAGFLHCKSTSERVKVAYKTRQMAWPK